MMLIYDKEVIEVFYQIDKTSTLVEIVLDIKGVLYFKYKNIYGEEITKNNKYIITMTVIDVNTTKVEEYLGTLDFRLIKE